MVQSLDFGRFSGLLAKKDLARPNLFKVVFSNLGMNISEDGVINFSTAEVDSEGVPNDEESGGGLFESVRSRVQDKAQRELLKRSSAFRRLSGAYSPKIIRMLGGGDLIDGMLGLDQDLNKDISLMVKGITLPGSSLETEVVMADRRPWHIAKGRTQRGFTMTFMSSPDLVERRMMQAWMNAIHDPYTNTFEFYNVYKKDIDIYTYDRSGRVAHGVHLKDCYPIDVSDVELSWDSNNEFLTFTVEFVTSIVSEVPGTELSGGDAGNIFDDALGVFNEASAVSNNLGLIDSGDLPSI